MLGDIIKPMALNIDERLKVQIRTQIKKAVSGQSANTFSKVNILLSREPQLRSEMATLMVNYLKDNRELFTMGRFESNLEHLTEDIMATYFMLETTLILGIDKGKEGYPSSLYTNNYEILKTLEQHGLIQGSNVDEVYAKFNKKRRIMIKDASFCAIRLDLAVYTKEGDFQFKLMIPQYMDIGNKGRFFLTPLAGMYEYTALLTNNKTPIRITESNPTYSNPRIKVVSFTNELMIALTPKGVAEHRMLNHTNVGFNPVKLTLDMWDLEAHKMASGITSIRPELITRIEAIQPSQVDTSLASVDITTARYYYRYVVAKQGKTALESLNYSVSGTTSDLIDTKNYRTLLQGVQELESNMSLRQLYLFMITNPQVFGSKQDILTRMANLYGFLAKPVQVIDLPEEATARVKYIRQLATQGVIEFVYQNKQGRLSQRKYTTNPEMLEKFLGESYIRNYETDVTRLKAFAVELESYKPSNYLEAQEIMVEYKVTDILPFGFETMASYQQQEVIKATLQKIYDSMEQEGTLVTLRNIAAQNKHSFVMSINTENIMSSVKLYMPN